MKKTSFGVVLIVLVVMFLLLGVLGILAYAGVEPVASQANRLFRRVENVVPRLTIAQVGTVKAGVSGLTVSVTPSSSAVADKKYTVDLFEKGQLRDHGTISWNQPEINVSKVKTLTFPLTKTELSAYSNADVSHIFTAYVHE
jgi:hypothetical protein